MATQPSLGMPPSNVSNVQCIVVCMTNPIKNINNINNMYIKCMELSSLETLFFQLKNKGKGANILLQILDCKKHHPL